jgi:hypothetical protein
MFFRHTLRVTQPRANDVRRPALAQFDLARRPEAVEYLRPGLQAGRFDDGGELRPEVAALALIRNYMHRPRPGFLKGFAQVRQQFGE